MKSLITIILILFACNIYGQTTLVAHGNTLWLKNNATGDSSRVVTTSRLADSLAAVRAASVPSTRFADSLAANRSLVASTYSPIGHTHTGVYQPVGSYSLTSHTHAYNTLTGLPTLFTQATADGLYSVLAHTHTFASLTSKPTTIAGYGITDAEPTITTLSFAKGGISGAVATSATTGAQTVNMTSEIITITPTGATTLNASGGVAGQRVTFVITTSGVSSFNVTFGTNFRSIGVLATGTTTAKIFTVSFLCTNGTQWVETGRTAAQ